MKLKLDMTVYHQDVYDGREPLKVIGIKKDIVELEGDYSGGTNNVCQSDWLSISGVLFEKSTEKINPLSINLENINGVEILEFLNGQIRDNEDLCDISLCAPLKFEKQSLGKERAGELMYSLSFSAYHNNWGTDQLMEGNEIQITSKKVKVLVVEPFEGDGSDEELENVLLEWIKTRKFKSNKDIKKEFYKLTNYVSNDLYHLEYDDKERIEKLIKKLVDAKELMK